MSIDPKFIDELLKQYRTPEDILGRDGLIKQLTKAVLERALEAELGHHLRQEPAAGVAHAGETHGAPEGPAGAPTLASA